MLLRKELPRRALPPAGYLPDQNPIETQLPPNTQFLPVFFVCDVSIPASEPPAKFGSVKDPLECPRLGRGVRRRRLVRHRAAFQGGGLISISLLARSQSAHATILAGAIHTSDGLAQAPSSGVCRNCLWRVPRSAHHQLPQSCFRRRYRTRDLSKWTSARWMAFLRVLSIRLRRSETRPM